MSVNYYWITQPDLSVQLTFKTPVGEFTQAFEVDEDDPRIHIGKTASDEFIWAQHPDVVRKVCEERRAERLVRAEHGVEFTGAEFLQVVASCPKRVLAIGERFC